MDKENNEQKICISAICGSLRKNSYTLKATKTALEGARETGAEVKLIDLTQYNLVFCDGNSKDREYPEDVYTLRREVKESHGVIWATPEYHGGYSGVLKNALDLMGFEEFEGKLLGLIGVSGGQMGAMNALSSLRDIGRSLHCWVIPEQIAIPEVWKMFDQEGNINNPEIEKKLKHIGRQVARFAFLHHSDKSKEFLRLWEEAPENPGGDNA